MKRLLSYLGRQKVYTVMAPLFKCLEACFELFVPLVVAQMIDVGIASGDRTYILKMGGLLILLGLIGLLCSITAQWFSADVAVKTGTALRNDLFSHITHLGYTEIDRLGTSTLLTRMTSDINQIQTGVNMFLRLFMRSPFIVFGSVIMAFSVDRKAALIFAVTVPLLMLVVFGILLGTMPLYRRVQSRLDRVMLTTRENLSGVRVIRAFSREESEKARYRAQNDDLMRLQIFTGKISALLNPLTVVIVNLAIAALLLFGGKQVMAGGLTQGTIVALINYMSQILVELVKLANLIILISKAAACMKRVDAVFAVENSLRPAEAFGENSRKTAGNGSGHSAGVCFQKVGFSYAGAKEECLSEIDFSAAPGETIGIIGGTGSGKSTMVNLIPRFYDVTRGAVLIDGRDVRSIPEEELRARIGIAPQKAVLFAGSLRDNLRFRKPDASEEELFRALSVAQAAEIVEQKGEGLSLRIEQDGSNLSGGQRQRFAVARALVGEPEILILDDSASALDFATDSALRKALRESTDGMTVFLISQRAATVKAADRILVLDDGKQVGFGTHRQLLKDCPVYREICLSQMSREEVLRDETE